MATSGQRWARPDLSWTGLDGKRYQPGRDKLPPAEQERYLDSLFGRVQQYLEAKAYRERLR